MSENNLTPEMDLATREFFKMVITEENVQTMNTAAHRSLVQNLLALLNYTWLPNGVFVMAGTKIVMEYGKNDYSAYHDEWAADEERAHEAIDLKAKDEASSGSQSENSEVREAVLPEDV